MSVDENIDFGHNALSAPICRTAMIAPCAAIRRFDASRSWKALFGALLVTTAPHAYAQVAPAPGPVQQTDPAPAGELAPPSADPGQAPLSDPELTGDGSTPAEITVTGSRITRNGYDQPTPVTAIGVEDIQAAAPSNLADFVNQIPSVSGSVTPSNSQRSLSSGTAGVNSINLRNLGSSRTLILLDGKRSVGSVITGTVDVNTIPQGLVKSVEIVTGGASSVYGSDAVAGVVNFIFDRTYTGLKGEADYGETTYGDDKTFRASLTGGFSFGGDRGHVLLNGQITQRDGVFGVPRPWAGRGIHITTNPRYIAGNGEPEFLPAFQSGLNTLTGGGIITNGVARGTYFGSGGSVNQYNYGPNRLNNSPWTIGGDWQISQHYYGTSIQPEEKYGGVFGRASYEVVDDLEFFFEGSWNKSKSYNWGGYATDKANVTIYRDNPFIPDAVYARLFPGGVRPTTTATSARTAAFTLGSWNQDLPTRQSDNTRDVQRYVFGVEGKFDLLGADWNWDGYYQKGITKSNEVTIAANRTQWDFAQDAVRNAAGQIVCRVTLQGSTNPLAAGCVPYNRMGIGVNSQAAIDYIIGEPERDQKFEQDVAAINVNTNISGILAKPIGIAFGVESRQEKVSGTVAPEFQTGWISGNFLPTNGTFTVYEGYGETLVPLPLAFEFNGAARYTRYSESGSVVTWKGGLTWQPIEDIRLRLTRSRDIRAPNLSELFAGGTRNTNSLQDAYTGTVVRYTQTVAGNTDLQPEKADTLGFGVVLRPSFLPGFGASIDYYDIKIKDAISTLSPQQIVDRCAGGNIELCRRLTAVIPTGTGSQNVAFGTGGFTSSAGPGANLSEYLIANSPFNFLQNRARGLDFEVSYQFGLDKIASSLPGSLTLRGLATRYLEASVSNGIDPKTDDAGENGLSGPADWTYRVTANYATDALSLQVIGRGISAGVYDNDYVECTTGCPASTAINRTIANNRLPGAFYLDTYFSYNVAVGGAKGQLYLRVANLLNKDPAPVGKGPSDNSNPDPGINQTLYDFLGRTFRVGVRFALGG